MSIILTYEGSREYQLKPAIHDEASYLLGWTACRGLERLQLTSSCHSLPTKSCSSIESVIIILILSLLILRMMILVVSFMPLHGIKQSWADLYRQEGRSLIQTTHRSHDIQAQSASPLKQTVLDVGRRHIRPPVCEDQD
ncbi:hypothetical protein P170DRAFT_275629 [Aspergillus steynii IBT 23096]|uniref:Uncharacterized protein n=1 Tax=Aspergillus steynii IBT 23096 TaxID=1392250 RepID=A0A2I2FX82_9EURO|nr:uncharacterized protein P170DRAFT_275629 [Aspergillus steynii IBT 23096]PLB45222.1 hypothetical protein P170DRAFT_275629 [Aspergillus steynii IBT 23096]